MALEAIYGEDVRALLICSRVLSSLTLLFIGGLVAGSAGCIILCLILVIRISITFLLSNGGSSDSSDAILAIPVWRMKGALSRVSSNLLHRSRWDVTGMISVKGGRPLVSLFKRMVRLVVGETTGAQVRAIVYVLRVFSKVACKQGIRGLVLYSKTCYVLLQQSLGGFKVHDSGEIGSRISRTHRGLPRIIPAPFRLRIVAGDKAQVRIWLTLFSIYRVLEFPGKLKLGTITDKGKNWGHLLPEVISFIPHF